MCSFITQHNATDVASFEGACTWHADCRNVHQSCWDRLRPATWTADATVGLHDQRISTQIVRNHLRKAHLHAGHPHQFVVITDLSGQMLTFDGTSGTLENCSFHGWILVFTVQGRWQTVCMVLCGEQFTDVSVVNRVPHGGGRVMVWADISYRQQRQMHIIDGNLNEQRYCDKILRLIVMPFTHSYRLMLQHDNARRRVARICTQFLEAKNMPVLAWPAYSPDMSSMFGMLWISVYNSVFCQYPATLHSHWRRVDQHSKGHNQQPDQLCAQEMCRIARGKWRSHQILTCFLPSHPKKCLSVSLVMWNT